MRTAAEVARVVCPRARPEYLRALELGSQLFVEAEITTPLRLAHFLAQIFHESGALTIQFENMNYKAARIMEIFGVGHHSARVTEAEARTLARNPYALAERVYGVGNPKKAHELGNERPGDGYKYRGGGIMQTTGGGSYKTYGERSGADFYGQPDLIVSAEHCLKPALYEWVEKRCNVSADANDIGGVTRKINGGTNGLADRKQWFARVYPLVKGGEKLEGREAWRDSLVNDDVKFVQDALNKLGANPPLNVDGRSGPATEAAVRWFQRKNGIPADGDAGPVTIAAIKDAMASEWGDAKKPTITTTTEGKASIGTGALASLEAAREASNTVKELKENVEGAGVFEVLGTLASRPGFWVILVLIGVCVYFYFKHKKETE